MKVVIGVQVKHFPFAAREVTFALRELPFVCKASHVFVLDDGIYDVIVLDARDDADDVMHIELALSSGAHRGEVVKLSARGVQRSWIDLIGTPATLTVEGGRPRVAFE